ncbi:MAG: hypothetical protein AAGN35_05635 [Bacteroidota bacterium]
MKQRISIVLLALLMGAGLFAQQPARVSLPVEKSFARVQSNLPAGRVSMRIQEGKIWVNDKLIPKKELPKSLRELDKAIYYETAVFGVQDVAFNLGEYNYLLRDGKIVELERPKMPKSNTNSGYADLEAKKAYYSQLKKDAPGLFYSLSREAALVEQVRSLLIEYEVAPEKQKAKLKAEMRLLLDQLFDINEHNQKMEITELEQMLDAAKQEVKFRQDNKGKIVTKMLDDLLR